MINLNDKEIELFEYIKSLMGNNEEIKFDFNDPKQYEFAVMMTENGFDTELYPGKLKALEVQKESHINNGFIAIEDDPNNPFVTNFSIPGIGIDPGANVIASNGLGTVANGYSAMNLNIMVQDNITKNIVASGSNQGYSNTVLNVATAINPQISKSMNVTSYLYYSYSLTTGGVPSTGMIQKSTNNGTTGDPVITAPVVTRTSQPLPKNKINIGLNRPVFSQGGVSDMDYCYYDPNTVNQPLGRVPFVGSVIFAQPIKPLIQGTTIQLTINVTNINSGGTATTIQVSNLTQVYNSFTIDAANPNKLNWNLRPPTSPTDLGQPIMYQNITWPSDLEALFYCFIIVILQDGTPGFVTIQSQNASEDDPLDGSLAIKPLSFIWHCLGEDTVVKMADGNEKPIADLVSGDKVVTNNKDGVATVEWTNKGAHYGNVLVITTNDDKKVTTSHNHIFITEKGEKLAIDLVVGDVVLMDTGNSKISCIETIPNYKGMFYNIATVEEQDPTNSNASIGTYIANGFIVGDINAQRVIRYKQQNDIEWVKKQLPDYLHKDAETFFKLNIK